MSARVAARIHGGLVGDAPPASGVRFTSETKLVSAALDYLRQAGIFAARNNVGKRGRVRFGLGVGSADIIAVVRGRMVALEAKKVDGVVSDEQHEWRRKVEQAGAIYAVVRSIDDVRAAVEKANLASLTQEYREHLRKSQTERPPGEDCRQLASADSADLSNASPRARAR